MFSQQPPYQDRVIHVGCWVCPRNRRRLLRRGLELARVAVVQKEVAVQDKADHAAHQKDKDWRQPRGRIVAIGPM